MEDRTTEYVSLQLALIAIFKLLDLDFLCAARTAPCQSWRNPVERIMSTLNLGLQCVGLMREKMDDTFESEASQCKSLKELCEAAKRRSGFREEAIDSVSHVKVLLTQIFARLQLKEKKFTVFNTASLQSIEELWRELQSVDFTLTSSENLTKRTLQTKPALKDFLAHCCVQRKYMFQVKKCGSLTCSMCKPPRLSAEVFNRLKYVPDPVPGEEGHYKPFAEVYGTNTTEQYVPSMMSKTQRKKTLPFASNLRHVKNVDMMLQCDECDSWRLLYPQNKLSHQERKDLEEAVADYSFTCGAPLQDLNLPGKLAHVYVRDMSCGDPIEKLYYTAKYPPICVYCATSVEPNPDDTHYPQCKDCSAKPQISKD